MTIAIVALAATILLYLRTSAKQVRELHDHLARQEQRHSFQMNKLLAQKNPDLEQLIALIDRQMQRIQAPSQAVVDHSVGLMPPSPPAVGFDDDAAFWKSRDLSAEELAEMEMQAELRASSVAA